MLRLAHISDTHLGKRQYGSEIRKQDYLDAFEESIDRCIELDVTAIIHTGDLFDDPNPDIQTLDETMRVLEKLEDSGIEFYGIVGNHERKRSGQWMDLIKRLGNTHRLSTEPTYITDDDESVVIYGFDAIRRPQWNTTDFTVTPPSEEFTDAPTIVCFHELFTPPLEEITADYDLEPVLKELNITPDIVALGDNHTPEEASLQLDDTETVAYYPGSTEKTSRNDPTTHSFIALGIEDNEITTRSPVELDSPRPFIHLPISFEEGDGTSVAEHAFETTDFTTPPGEKNPVVVVTLTGVNTGITHNEIRRLAEDYSITHLKIEDDRQSTKFEDSEFEVQQTATDIETAINNSLEQVQLSQNVTEIEDIVRDTDSVPNSHIRDEVESILTDNSEETTNSNNGDTQ